MPWRWPRLRPRTGLEPRLELSSQEVRCALPAHVLKELAPAQHRYEAQYPVLSPTGGCISTCCLRCSFSDSWVDPIRFRCSGSDHPYPGCVIDNEHIANRVAFYWRRVAVTSSQFNQMKDQFGIPVKRTDTLAPDYVAKYGDQCVEVDAISSTEVGDMLQTAITKSIDMQIWEQTQTIESCFPTASPGSVERTVSGQETSRKRPRSALFTEHNDRLVLGHLHDHRGSAGGPRQFPNSLYYRLLRHPQAPLETKKMIEARRRLADANKPAVTGTCRSSRSMYCVCLSIRTIFIHPRS
jgi:hypothetical protein